MSAIVFGSVVVEPDSNGIMVVSMNDASRMVAVNPARFASPWYTPVVDDVVAVSPGTPFWTLLWVAGRGTATYVYSG